MGALSGSGSVRWVSQTKILATMGLGEHQELLAVTLPSFERYAARHGYEVRIPESDPAPERKFKQWSKIAFINQLLPTCDLLFWVDSDAAILDDSVDIGTTLPARHFLGLVEHHYDGLSVPNTGVMIIRGGRKGRRFFKEMWNHTEYLETKWFDNAAALDMLGYEFDSEATQKYCRPGKPTPWSRRTQLIPNEWNSLPQDMANSPRILHVTRAFPFEERLERLRAALS